MKPIWLNWARELQAIAQTGLAYSKDPYDHERYRAIRSLAARIMAEHSETEFSRIQELFSEQAGYATPKVDVRGSAAPGVFCWCAKPPMPADGRCRAVGRT
jgi:hypothetical protein